MVVHASVRASVVTAILAEFARLGGDPIWILERHGLAKVDVSDPFSIVPLARYVAMFEEMALRLSDPLLGARLGTATRPVDYGPAGLVMARSASLGAALARLTRFARSLQPGTHSAVHQSDDLLIWTYRLTDAAIWPRRQDAEFTISSLLRLLRTSFDSDWRPIQVQFEHGPTTAAAGQMLERLLGCPVSFKAASNGLILSLEDAQRRHRDEDHDLIAVLERYLTDMNSADSMTERWSDRVMALIATYLGQQPITMERLAADLMTSPRSLQRRLTEENTSVRQLLRAHRQELAGQQLASGAPSLGSLAETLGYADGTSFWRAHKNWTGKAPSDARRSRR